VACGWRHSAAYTLKPTVVLARQAGSTRRCNGVHKLGLLCTGIMYL
jgi:hypothetical protein